MLRRQRLIDVIRGTARDTGVHPDGGMGMRLITHDPRQASQADEAYPDDFDTHGDAHDPGDELALLEDYVRVAGDLTSRGQYDDAAAVVRQAVERWPGLNDFVGMNWQTRRRP